LELRSLFHQELEVARRRIRGGTNPDNWRLALHLSEIQGALERLRRIGALVEAPKEA